MPPWTSQAKEKQRQLIQQWQPWKSSSGLKSEAGKTASSKNALHID